MNETATLTNFLPAISPFIFTTTSTTEKPPQPQEPQSIKQLRNIVKELYSKFKQQYRDEYQNPGQNNSNIEVYYTANIKLLRECDKANTICTNLMGEIMLMCKIDQN